ncbi:hypothetical protein C7974DRAFT_409178 [Boeremia exigua]|uniref:uncharacterized protein n=1 Tax=Boeremia exigua TaxID=749465 RepID=UPI001E8E225C|nr:uncharacterized protein C7974DRAFT_409178 [Boeremia exigua]KAH6642638.1 hypothetical protein C7974DRAFT_409178 [Boeremia exigua]
MSSNSHPRHRATTSQGSFTSPLPQTPTFALPSHPRPAPASRRPPSEASDLSSRHSGPTIRIVDDPGNDVYDKFPLPSEPSQILPPPRNAPGYAFETPGSRVSSGSRVANALAKFEAIGASTTLAPQPPSYRPKNTFRHSASTNLSEDDTLVDTSNSRYSFRYSQGSTPPVSPGQAELKDFDTELEVLEEETTPLARRSTIRAVPPSSSGGESVESRLRALSPQESVASLASSTPPASLASPSNADRNSTGVSRSLPQEHTSSAGFEDGQQQAFDSDFSHRQLVLKPSEESFAYSDISSTSIEPKQPTYSPSPTIHEASTATWASGVKVSNPLVRAPTNSNLWAASQNAPNIAARMLDRGLEHNWSSQLSTIASVSERDSRSFARGSRSFSPRSHSSDSYAERSLTSLPRRRGQTVGSYNSSSDNYSSAPSESAVPLPLFSPQLQPSGDYNEKSFGDEDLDTVSPLPPSNTIRMKNSGYLRRQNSDTSLNSSRPGSSHSDVSTFNRSIIPAWARAYYQRGERISMIPAASESSGSIRLGTSHSGRTHTPSESNFPAHIYRPRNRPHHRGSHTDSMSLSSEQLIDDNGYAAGQISGWSTPHLRTDRREHPRYSFWKAPSMDKDFGQHPFSRQNRQILLFTLGFIFFPAWWIASCLPLPYDPTSVAIESQVEFEQQYAQQIATINDKAFQKATWWRNLNRVMSGVGTLLVGVIVALGILASRM